MDTELIRKLVEKAEESGSSRYRAYVLKKQDQSYELLMNGKQMAKFIVTGYEKGYLENNASKTDYQIKTVANLEKFLTGQY